MQDEHEWNSELYITAERLRERMAWLRRQRYSLLSLTEGVRRLHDGTLPEGSVAVTFDDGAADFALRAVPVLKEFDIPATVYLTTYYCDYRYPVFDTALSYILWKGRGASTGAVDLAGSTIDLRVSTDADRERTSLTLRDAAFRARFTAVEKHELLRRVAERLDVDFGAFLAAEMLTIMSPGQVRSLPRDLIDVQLHTHRHRTPRDPVRFAAEIAENRNRIAQLVDGEVSTLRHFSYPSGDYARAFRKWLHDAGIESATTCVPGIAEPEGDPLLLPRFIDTMQTSQLSFEAWVSGFAQLLPRQRRHRLDRSRE